MSSTPIHSLRARFSALVQHQPAHAPIARISRSANLLGAAPQTNVSLRTAAAEALSGVQAAQRNNAPNVPLLAPGAHIDAYA